MTAMPYVSTHTEDDGSLSLHKSLLDAASRADVTAVLHALQEGADPHFVDAGGRTVVGCAVAGERWEKADALDASFFLEQRLEILKALIHHAKISLAALNAPLDAMRGVTPLGLAAWLNIPDIVRLLLNECPGLVSVNGMDASGATPLMYAARDGRVEVVHDLLMNGARPDYRDVNHRSSVQYALRHPQVLWLCESALRRHRASDNARAIRSDSRVGTRSRERFDIESQAIVCHPRFALKPAKQDTLEMVNTLLSAVKAGNPQELHSLLVPAESGSIATPPPFLINYPDAQGWCAIHHCMVVETPSLEIVDILYRAGADLSLYTRSGHGTPLHCLARRAFSSTPHSVTELIRHLILDLKAPLAAKDAEDETPLHVAAEHGHSFEILLALLICDTNGTVQEMRNTRGLTPLEVAQPHLKAAFIQGAETNRSTSSASTRTIKPSTAFVGAAGVMLCADPLRLRLSLPPRKKSNIRESISDLNIRIFPHSIIENLLSASRELDFEPENVNFAAVEDLIQQTTEMGEDVLVHMQSRLNHAATELSTTRQKMVIVESLVGDVRRIAELVHGASLVDSEHSWEFPDAQRRRTTESNSSDRTAISSASASSATLLHLTEKSASDAYILLSVHSPQNSRPQFFRGMDAIQPVPSASTSYPSSLHDTTQLLRPTRSLVDLRQHSLQATEDKGFLKFPWVRDITRKRSKSDIQVHVDASERASFLWVGDSRESSASSVSKVKAWFRKKLMPDLPVPSVGKKSADALVAEDLRGRTSNISRISTSSALRPNVQFSSVATRRVIHACDIDLQCIREDVSMAEHYINHASRSIAQARRLLARSIEHRKTQLIHARHTRDFVNTIPPNCGQFDVLEFLPVTIPTSTRDSQLVFPKPPSVSSSFSSASSITSVAVNGDEDLRALRRLITRKIDSRTDNANEHLAKAMMRVQIVKDIARTLRRNLS